MVQFEEDQKHFISFKYSSKCPNFTYKISWTNIPNDNKNPCDVFLILCLRTVRKPLHTTSTLLSQCHLELLKLTFNTFLGSYQSCFQLHFTSTYWLHWPNSHLHIRISFKKLNKTQQKTHSNERPKKKGAKKSRPQATPQNKNPTIIRCSTVLLLK